MIIKGSRVPCKTEDIVTVDHTSMARSPRGLGQIILHSYDMLIRAVVGDVVFKSYDIMIGNVVNARHDGQTTEYNSDLGQAILY